MARMIYGGAQIRSEIKRLFSHSRRRRVAVVAFVSTGAEKYLPTDPNGIELICWPKAGGTHPRVLRELKEAGVEISFADRMHAKIFWCDGIGAVVGSANLGDNALGESGLTEMAVVLGARNIDLDKVLAELVRRRPMRANELAALELAHRRFWRKHPQAPPTGSKRAPDTTFEQWYSHFCNRDHSPWKLGWWAEDASLSTQSKLRARNEYGARSVSTWIECRKGEFDEPDMLLQFKLGSRVPRAAKWMYVDFVQGKGRQLYGYEAVEVRDHDRALNPFAITDKFVRALQAALKTFGFDKLRALRNSRPPVQFIEMLAEQMGCV